MKLASACLLAAIAAAPCARAEDTTPDQAQALETAIVGWLAGLVGSTPAAGERPVAVAPDGDGFALSVPGTGTTPVTARLTRQDDDHWSATAIRLPTPLRGDGAPPAGGSWTVTLGEQTTTATLDRTLAGPSRIDGHIAGYDNTVEAPGGTRSTRVDDVTFSALGTPAGTSLLDASAEVGGTGLKVQPPEEGPPTTIGKVSGKTAIAAVDVDKVVPLARALAAYGDARNGPPAAPGSPPPSPHETFALLRNFAAGFEQHLSAERITTTLPSPAGPMAASVDAASLSIMASAPQGKSDISAAMDIAGLRISDLPPGPIGTYVPTRLVLKPHLTGLPAAAVWDLVERATELGQSDPAAMQAALGEALAKGQLTAAIDELLLETKAATLAAHGAVQVISADRAEGSGTFRLTGIDALMKDASTIPGAKQALPVLLFLKGLGRKDGDATVWDVRYENHKLTVNGTDLSKMLPRR